MKKVQTYLIIFLFCFSLDLYAQVPDWQWVKAIHTSGYELARDVAADPVTGNIYIAGAWEKDLDVYFPGNLYPSTDFSSTYGEEDGLVVKYDQNGTILWAFKIGGDGDDEASAITLDSSGNIYITGYIDDGTNYFSGTSSSTPDSTIDNSSGLDFFIAKYNPDGALLWVRHSDGSSGNAKGLSIYAENSSVFASGYCTGSTSFGLFSGSFNQGDEDYFVAKYDGNGSEQWLLEGGSDESDFAHDVLSDGTNVYFVGSFTGTTLSVPDTSGTNVVSMANANSGKTDIFILSFDVNSNYNWSQKISSMDHDDGYGITHDTDSLYITGGINNFANFPDYINNPVTVSSNKDIFISSHSKTNGNTGWVRAVACTNGADEEGLDIVIDITHSIYVTGYFRGDLNFGDTTITAIGGNPDIFVASFLDNGTFNWAKMAGSTGALDVGYGISTDNSKNIYIAGHYDKQTFFDTITLPDDVGENIFLANIELGTCIDAEGGTASISQDHICLSESTTISLAGYYGIIQWQSSPYGSNNWTDISGENAPTLVVSPNGTTDYRAFLTSDPCQPDSSNTITVNVDLQPAADAGPGGDECDLDFVLSATPSAGTGTWTKTAGSGNAAFTPNANTPGATVTVDAYDTYQFTWTEVNGTCSNDSTITVNFYEPPIADAGPGGDECDLDFVLSATPSAGTGTWTKTAGPGTASFTPNEYDPQATVTVTTYGTYEFIRTEVNDICADDASITINFYRQPVANAGPDQIPDFPREITMQAELTGSETGEWLVVSGSGDFEDIHLPMTRVSGLSAGENIFSWEVTNGVCTDFDEMKIIIDDLLIPSVITPNGDMKNDYFVVRGIDISESVELTVFNRWSAEVYKNNMYQNNWDGRDHNGNELPADTYFYVIKLVDGRVLKGFVVIKR